MQLFNKQQLWLDKRNGRRRLILCRKDRNGHISVQQPVTLPYHHHQAFSFRRDSTELFLSRMVAAFKAQLAPNGMNCGIAQKPPTYTRASTFPPNPSCLRNPLPNFPHRAIWYPLWLNPQDLPKELLLLASQQTGSLPTFRRRHTPCIPFFCGIRRWDSFVGTILVPRTHTSFFVWEFLRLAEPSPRPFILFYCSGKLKWARKPLLTPSTVWKAKYTDIGRR